MSAIGLCLREEELSTQSMEMNSRTAFKVRNKESFQVLRHSIGINHLDFSNFASYDGSI